MTEHTPAPWYVTDNPDDRYSMTAIGTTPSLSTTTDEYDGWYIATVMKSCDVLDNDCEEYQANASLIASAPTMHETLIEIRDLARDGVPLYGIITMIDELLESLEGES